ncbi:MAG: hypothetical protein HZT40_10185 [Candidatus Thiothrix singaporensis]|uniref:Uncharacterized protein n=1 Tax=Candidatus Thiothrix singaporensis TaxID=2799669 RepID=A0A7L6ARZ8_9GAMM|nr:MAG: hypothetical protein HZT40_10185 [Candidatus Thiothrix singaporensis]
MFPLNFLVGAAIGAASTYVYKDEPAKNWVTDTSKKLKDAASSFMESMKTKPEVEETMEAAAVETAAVVAEAAPTAEATITETPTEQTAENVAKPDAPPETP